MTAMDSLPRTIQPKLPPSLALSSLYASATYDVPDQMFAVSVCPFGVVSLFVAYISLLKLKENIQKYLVEGDARLELLDSLQRLALLVAEDVADLDAVGGLQRLASLGIVIYDPNVRTTKKRRVSLYESLFLVQSFPCMGTKTHGRWWWWWWCIVFIDMHVVVRCPLIFLVSCMPELESVVRVITVVVALLSLGCGVLLGSGLWWHCVGCPCAVLSK